MKKTLFSLIFLATNVLATMAQSEDEAIRRTIEEETRTFHTNPDRSVFLSYWNISDASLMLYSGGGNVVSLTGTQMKDATTNGTIPPPDEAVASYENFVIRSSGNVAWATFTQQDTKKDGTKTAKLQEFRLLEKINGAWKITSSSVHQLK